MISNEAPLLDGWISREECGLVSKWMKSDTGDILETGSAIGRLFDFLYSRHRQWNYVSVDPLHEREVYIQLDYNKRYWEDGNRGPRVTNKTLQNNIPFAEHHACDFEEFETDKKFDVISMGMNNPNVNWPSVYKKAFTLLKPGGVIIGRNIYDRTGAINRPDGHPGVTVSITRSIKKYIILDGKKGSFVIDGTRWKHIPESNRYYDEDSLSWRLKT